MTKDEMLEMAKKYQAHANSLRLAAEADDFSMFRWSFTDLERDANDDSFAVDIAAIERA